MIVICGATQIFNIISCYLLARVSGVSCRSQILTLQNVSIDDIKLNKIIVMNDPTPKLGILHLPNIALKQDPHPH